MIDKSKYITNSGYFLYLLATKRKEKTLEENYKQRPISPLVINVCVDVITTKTLHLNRVTSRWQYVFLFI